VTRHDHLVSALDLLLAKLEQGDAVAAEVASQAALSLFAATPSPGADERLGPLYERCRLAMAALSARLDREVKETATSTRAGRAYAAFGAEE
jgi:hypothetical protein